MSNFYLSDTKVLKENKLNNLDFRIYSYCCHQFNVKTLSSFIRLVDISGTFQIGLDQVQDSLDRLARIHIDGLALISIKDAGKYLVFDMPRHKYFVTQLGFTKFGSSKGWSTLKNHTQQFTTRKYLYPKLDQYELYDVLKDLPREEFDRIKETDLMYSWVYRDVKKHRESN